MNVHGYNLEKRKTPTFYFIGVTTGQSSINKVFPLWMEEMGRPEVVLEGIDHKIHGDPQAYRESVAQIKYDPNSLGALVTTHKIDLYDATQEVNWTSCIKPWLRPSRATSQWKMVGSTLCMVGPR